MSCRVAGFQVRLAAMSASNGAVMHALAERGYRLVGAIPNARLTVVIPFHAGADRPDIFDRIASAVLDSDIPRDAVQFLVADDASSAENQAKAIAQCERLGMSYLSTGDRGPFSRARARNAAAMVASSDYLMLFDVDLMPYDGFFRDVLREIDVQELDTNPRRFVMFPAAYLTETGSREFLASDPATRRQRFLHAALIGSAAVERVSTGTSVIVVRREHYLACGGMSEDFQGWGFEDHELICRLMFLAGDFPEPQDPLLSYGNFSTITEYRGWRALYRLYGDLTYRKGMVVFHRWHAAPIGVKRQNEGMFHRKLEAWYYRGEQPAPLPSLVDGQTPPPSPAGTPWQLSNFSISGVFAPYVHARRGWAARLSAPARRAYAKLRPKLGR